MTVYIINIVSILLLSLFLFVLMPIKYKTNYFLVVTFMQLLSISALRYNIGIDFSNYRSTFNLVSRTSNFNELISLSQGSGMEIGYIYLNKLVSLGTAESQWIFVVTSFVILYFVFITVKNNSSITWLSIYMFAVESYIASLNIQRQFIAVGICFYSYKFIKKREFIKFLILSLVASLFHRSALIFLPLYFILNIKLNIKNIILVLLTGVVFNIMFEFIISIIQVFFYSNYVGFAFGVKRGNINNVIIASIYFVIAMYYKKPLLERDKNNTILINLSFINLFLSIMSLNLWIITRLMPFTSIFLILLVPEIVSCVKDRHIRVIMLLFFISFTFFIYLATITNPANKLIPYSFISFSC